MKSFSQFIQLDEALTSPVQFVLTDDTKPPKRIAATFNLDGSDYGMSLEESQWKKTYLLKFYRIANSKVRLWKFTKKTHILPCLSTLLKFAEAAIPFTQGGQFDAILIEYNKKQAAQARVEKFIQRMIKKTYINTFRFVPVEGNIKNATYAYAFIVNKKKSPTQIFNSKGFKNIEFDPKEPVPLEAAEQLHSTAPVLNIVSTTPSSKFKLGKFELGVDANSVDDIIKKVSKVAPVVPTSTKESDTEKEQAKKDAEAYDKYEKVRKDLASKIESLIIFANPVFSKMANSLMKYGYDENKINYQNLEYVAKEARDKFPAWTDLAKSLGYYYSDGAPHLSNIKAEMPAFASWAENNPHAESAIENTRNLIKDLEKTSKEKPKEKPILNQAYVDTIHGDFDISQLIADNPHQSVDIQFNSDYGAYRVGTNSKDLLKYISHDLGYNDAIINMKSTQYTAMKNYTGPEYGDFNNRLRDFQNKLKNAKNESHLATYAKNVVDNKKIMTLWEGLKSLPPLPKSMWVFRNCLIDTNEYKDLKPGDEFVDAAFLSTSIREEMGYGGPNKIAIYLPKGTPMLPALEESSNSSEMEIILPPMSILKVLRVDKAKRYSNNILYNAVTIYTGTAFEDFVELAKSAKKKNLSITEAYYLIKLREYMAEQDKKQTDKKYDPEKKWGLTFSNKKSVEILKKLMNKGKLKNK